MIICGQYVIIRLNHMWFAHNHMWSWPNPHIWGIDMFVYDSYTSTHIPILTMFICEHAEKWSYTNTHIPILAMFICEHAEKWSYTCTHIPTLAMFICEHTGIAHIWVLICEYFWGGNNLFVYECSHMSSHTNIEDVNMWAIIYRHCECSYVNIGATHTWPLPYSRRCSYVNIGATHMWPLPYSNMWVLICCYSYGILLWL